MERRKVLFSLRPMKLMFVTRIFAELGGFERVWTDKMNALSELGYEICLVTTDQGTHAFPYILSEKVRHIDIAVRLTQKYSYRGVHRALVACRLMKRFKKAFLHLLELERPDILIGNTSTFTDAIIKWRSHIPIIIESHGIFDRPYHMEKMTFFKYLKAYIHHRIIAKADMVVALTKEDAVRWRTVNPNVCVIPNMVHLNRSGSYSSCTNKRVIFVGRFDAQKGYEYLVDIWKKVFPCHSDWRLDIYGEGADSEMCKSMIPQEMNIYVHGQTPNMIDRYKESSILILTSVYEPFGLVMPEAMSCGVPVVSFDCPDGPRNIISNGEDGFLVVCGDKKNYAEKLCQLMENEELRVSMGQRAIDSVSRFSEHNIIPLWQDVFYKVKKQNKKVG